MKLRLSKLELDDIKSIHAFIVEHWGEEQAHRHVTRLWDAFERILAAPQALATPG